MFTTLENHLLRLRPWQDCDIKPFTEMSDDPDVMQYLLPFSPQFTPEDWINKQTECLYQHGFCYWALERVSTGEFIGTAGLNPVSYNAHFTPAIEVGWRLSRTFWGKGYATQAAKMAINFAFTTLNLPEVVAVTVTNNRRSRSVMERLGMSFDPAENFLHPKVPDGHPLQAHVLYRIKKEYRNNRF